ncbi:MAG: S24/S26 family peptidase [Ruminococcus sp.]|nr:S24/S26 family peptidase [Ruminococcus sp.]
MRKTFKLSDYDDTIRFILESGGEFRMYPRGTSMLPLLVQERDSVVLKKPDGSLKKNDIAFYLRDNGQYVLHRVISCTDGKYVMCGDNQLHLETSIEDRHVIGVVCSFSRNGKETSIDSASYKLYVLLWQSFFIRRVFFKLRRLKNVIKTKFKR